MTLGQVIEQYINSHGMSMTAFAGKAGLSTAYISMLIKGRKDGQLPIPTLDTYKAVSSAMDISVDALLENCGVISAGFAEFKGKRRLREQLEQFMPDVSDSQIELIDMICKMSSQDRATLLRLAKAMFPNSESDE